LRQKTLQIKSRGKEASIDPGLSPELVDFLEVYDKSDMGLLINVSLGQTHLMYIAKLFPA
jgi:hypothetical protein